MCFSSREGFAPRLAGTPCQKTVSRRRLWVEKFTVPVGNSRSRLHLPGLVTTCRKFGSPSYATAFVTFLPPLASSPPPSSLLSPPPPSKHQRDPSTGALTPSSHATSRSCVHSFVPFLLSFGSSRSPSKTVKRRASRGPRTAGPNQPPGPA